MKISKVGITQGRDLGSHLNKPRGDDTIWSSVISSTPGLFRV